MKRSPTDWGGGNAVSPDEAFHLLGNDTRIDILQALWDAFESGRGGAALSYSALFERVDIDDSGNFSYHLEKLIGPFVRSTDGGYELKQTGINVVRAIVTGTMTDDPTFGPTTIDVTCPICDSPVEVEYGDELLTAFCTGCEGLMAWNDEPGFLLGGLVPPAVIEQRPTRRAFRAAVTYIFHQAAGLHDGVCPHCASPVETSIDVCVDHDPGTKTLCRACRRSHMAEVWMVCSACKRSMFPPVRGVVLDEPVVTAFYHERGIEHRFATWQAAVRSFDVDEDLLSEEPLRMRFTVPAGTDELALTVNDRLEVLDVTR